MTTSEMDLLPLAQRLDALDPATDWQTRTELGEELLAALGPRAKEFSRRYEAIVERPTEHVLREMGLLPPPVDPLLAELAAAAAAYRHFAVLSRQAHASAEELQAASLAWQDAREAFADGPAAARLQQETDRIDAELRAERERPALHPHQLPGAMPAPEVDEETR